MCVEMERIFCRPVEQKLFCFLYAANGTETLAIPQNDGTYKLYGYKWFSSATDSDMSITLARIVNNSGQTVQVSSKQAKSYFKHMT